jgi:putative sigma-54 modulation protein
MEVIVSGRHFEVSEELRAYAEEKIGKLAREYAKLTSARVVMETERNWQIVEAHVNGKHLSLNAKASTEAMEVSVDAVFEKLERQLRKYLEKVQDHRIRNSAAFEQQPEEAEEEIVEEFEEVV